MRGPCESSVDPAHHSPQAAKTLMIAPVVPDHRLASMVFSTPARTVPPRGCGTMAPQNAQFCLLLLEGATALLLNSRNSLDPPLPGIPLLVRL